MRSKASISSESGSANDSRAARGLAPIAARSLRLTASARCPIASGGTNRRSKCTPSTCASVVTTSSAPRTGSIAAASSPGPTTIQGAVGSRALMRAMRACSPQSATVRGFNGGTIGGNYSTARLCLEASVSGAATRPSVPVGTGATHANRTQASSGVRAPLCRVGRSNEPAKAGGAAVVGRASGFLETEACTTRDLAARLGCYVGSDEPPKPSRAKQEPRSYCALRGGSRQGGRDVQ